MDLEEPSPGDKRVDICTRRHTWRSSWLCQTAGTRVRTKENRPGHLVFDVDSYWRFHEEAAEDPQLLDDRPKTAIVRWPLRIQQVSSWFLLCSEGMCCASIKLSAEESGGFYCVVWEMEVLGDLKASGFYSYENIRNKLLIFLYSLFNLLFASLLCLIYNDL